MGINMGSVWPLTGKHMDFSIPYARVCGNIRICRVWEVDRKNRHEGYCLASRGLPNNVRLWSRGTFFFFFFFFFFSICHPIPFTPIFFLAYLSFLKVDFLIMQTLRLQTCAMTIPWRLVTLLRLVTSALTMAYRDIQPMYIKHVTILWILNSENLSFPRNG